MSAITREQLAALAQQLLAAAAIFNPAVASTVGSVLTIGTQFYALLEQIKAEVTPEVWDQVQSDFLAAKAAFEASVAKQAQG